MLSHVKTVNQVLAAVLTPAALCGSVAVVTQFAVLTPVPISVIQAFETDTCLDVTGLWVVHVDVVVTPAGRAASTRQLRVPEVTWGALITPGTWKKKENKSTDVAKTEWEQSDSFETFEDI